MANQWGQQGWHEQRAVEIRKLMWEPRNPVRISLPPAPIFTGKPGKSESFVQFRFSTTSTKINESPQYAGTCGSRECP
ncbi:CO dehydrogenase/acetyl-CoA synthase complex subunit beta [Anopheles sinensis]|uniref:CO dehydrogenase/acetyl-CoA synthase complex subunit beta n=1 Tax=Anopheles sinensis TaxID=74873 RepID=A0A084WK77_ANOSI|nr:CO dehydrogenase/acetyl-CoA synthase complex subunit beta [Anopheles sinensis]